MIAGEITKLGKPCAVPFLLGGMVGAGMVLSIPLILTKGKLSGHLLRFLIKRKMRRVKKDIEKFAATTGEYVSRMVEQGTDTLEKSKSGLAETAQKSRSLYEDNREKLAGFYQSIGESIQKGKSIYEEQKKIADLSLAVLPGVYDELKGKVKGIAQPLAAPGGENQKQKESAESTKSTAPVLPIAAGTAAGIALVLLSSNSGKELAKDILKKDIVGFAVDAGKLLVDLKAGRR
jgi:hypothetical protein